MAARETCVTEMMMKLAFQKVLIATDFSAAAALALEYAHTLARRFDAALHVVHVVEELSPVALEFPSPELDAYQTRLVEKATRDLADAIAGLTDVAVSAEVLTGAIAPRIIEAAAALDADLIVMGTHGRGGVARLLMGSVAELVVRTADCPVLTVHDVRRAAEAAREQLST